MLDHIDTRMMIGDAARIARNLARLAATGFSEVIYTPSGPDIARELSAFMLAQPAPSPAAA